MAEVISRLTDLRRRFVRRFHIRHHDPRIEIVSTPTKDDQRWVEDLVEKRGWDELRRK